MTCPRCMVELACPCWSCREWRRKKTYPEPVTEIWVEDGETIECPSCGFRAGSSYWEDFSFYQYEREQETNKLIAVKQELRHMWE